MFDSTLLLAAAKTVTLLCGGLLTLVAYRAYRRTGAAALRALAVGIGLVTLGTVLGGTLHQGLGVNLVESVGVQSVFTAFGFAILAYSLYAGPVMETPE
ncbi:MAG: hypothetical protein ABEI96_09490 [Haloarculaceae archaeon]